MLSNSSSRSGSSSHGSSGGSSGSGSGRFSGCGNGSDDRRTCRMRDRQDAQLTECTIDRMYDWQDARLTGASSCSGSSGDSSGRDSGRAGQVANVMIRKGVTHSEKAGEFFMHLAGKPIIWMNDSHYHSHYFGCNYSHYSAPVNHTSCQSCIVSIVHSINHTSCTFSNHHYHYHSHYYHRNYYHRNYYHHNYYHRNYYRCSAPVNCASCNFSDHYCCHYHHSHHCCGHVILLLLLPLLQLSLLLTSGVLPLPRSLILLCYIGVAELTSTTIINNGSWLILE